MILSSPARDLAGRVMKDAGDDESKRVRTLWRVTIGTHPSEAEVAELTEFLGRQTTLFEKRIAALPAPAKGKSKPDAAAEALTTLGQALWSSNAFLYVD